MCICLRLLAVGIFLERMGVVVVGPRGERVWVRDQPRLQLVLQLQRVDLVLLLLLRRGGGGGISTAAVVARVGIGALLWVVSSVFIVGVLHDSCVGTRTKE